jgi:hypothetical protein
MNTKRNSREVEQNKNFAYGAERGMVHIEDRRVVCRGGLRDSGRAPRWPDGEREAKRRKDAWVVRS